MGQGPQNPSPDYFGDLAEEYSIEPTSKALRGEVPPLGRHGGQPQLEDVAFQLQEGQLSGVIQVGDKFIILRCEGRTERVEVDEKDVRDDSSPRHFREEAPDGDGPEVRGDPRPGADRQLPGRHVARAGEAATAAASRPASARTRRCGRRLGPLGGSLAATPSEAVRESEPAVSLSRLVAANASRVYLSWRCRRTICGRRRPLSQMSRLFRRHRPPFQVQVAERVTRLPPYMFGRINALLYKKRRSGDDVIDLGMGNPSDPPQEAVIEKLAEAARDIRNHGYSKNIGIANLRREVAGKYFRKYGVRLDPDSEVIVCLGSKEGFSHMCLALMGPGDTAIVPAPYFPIHVYADRAGLSATSSRWKWPTATNSCRTSPTPASTFTRGRSCWCSTTRTIRRACVVEQAFFDEVVKLASSYGFMVLSDFAYADVAFDGYQPPSFLASPGAAEVGVEFTTMSKGYNMAGWRVGFCSGNAEMIRALATIKGYYDYGMFQAIQIAAIVALRNTERRSRSSRRFTRAAATRCATACRGWAGT